MKATKELFANIIETAMPLHKHMKIKLLEVSDGYAKILFPFKPEYIGDPRSKRLHGGILSLAIDATGGAAAMTKLSSFEDKMATVDMRIDYLQPGSTQDLIVEGKIIRAGTRFIVTETKAYHHADKILAEGRAVYHMHRKEDEK